MTKEEALDDLKHSIAACMYFEAELPNIAKAVDAFDALVDNNIDLFINDINQLSMVCIKRAVKKVLDRVWHVDKKEVIRIKELLISNNIKDKSELCRLANALLPFINQCFGSNYKDIIID